MKIESKRHSADIIKKLRLNGVPEIVLYEYDKEAITNFCTKYPSTKYILRDLDSPAGKYYFCKDLKECVNNAKNYTGSFSLGVSCFAYKGLILLGEVLLTKEDITLIARTDEEANHRNIHDRADYNIHTTMEDNKLWDIPGCDLLIEYLIKHNLYDVIVEFVIYRDSVGVNKERVLIVELRSEY